MPETLTHITHPPEKLQAQVAVFATEQIEDNKNRAHILGNIGRLAAGSVIDITRTTSREEHHVDNAGKDTWTPKGTEVVVASGEEYTKFLQSVGGSRYEPIRYREELLTRYKQFKPIIDDLVEELLSTSARKNHPAFMGSGSHAGVFRIEFEGKDYAVRIPAGKHAVDNYIAGAELGKNTPHFEQIIAASYEDGVTVSEIMPGKNLEKTTSKDIAAITDEQLSSLLDTLAIADNRGIHLDLQPENIFYDPEVGFGIIDYSSMKVASQRYRAQSLGESAGKVSGILSMLGTTSTDKPEARTQILTDNLSIVQRFRRVTENKLDGKDRETVLETIGSITELRQKEIDAVLRA